MTIFEKPNLNRIEQLRDSVRGYRELEKAAAEFRGRAAMVRWSRSTEAWRPLNRETVRVFSAARIGRDRLAVSSPAPSQATN